MTPEEKKLLEETHALAKDSHRIIREMRREQWFGFFFRIIVWAVVLILPFYIYSAYLGPVLAKFAPPGSATSTSGYFGLPSSAELQKLIDSYKAKSQ